MKEITNIVCVPTDSLGGAERFLYNSTLALSKEGPVHVLIGSKKHSGGWSSLEGRQNIKIKYFPVSRESMAIPYWIFYIFKLSLKNNIVFALSSHVHINAMLSFFRKVGLLRARNLLSRESTVVEDRFFGFHRLFFLSLYRWFYGAQDVVICQTGYMKERLSEGMGRGFREKIVVIENPINYQYIRQCIESNGTQPMMDAKVKKALEEKRERNQFWIGVAGRLINIKNIDGMIIAFFELLEKVGHSIREQLVLVIAGEGEDYEKLKSIIDNSPYKDQVLLLGRVDSPYSLFSNFDLGVVPSKKEGFPNVVLEMMASGTDKILITPCAGDLNKLPGVFLCQGYESHHICKGMFEMMKDDRIFSRVYLEYAASRSVEKFWERVNEVLSS